MRICSILLCTICVFFPAGLLGQTVDVRGVVVDSATGERIPYATVVVKPINRGAATNLSGFYIIPGVPFGTYVIVASAVGYSTVLKTVRVRGAEPVTLGFSLPQSPVELSEVVVQGERSLEKLDAASLHVLGQDDVQKVPGVGQEDLLRAMQVLPGVGSTADVSSKFYVRGGAGDQNLILLDGMKIYNPYHAFGIFSVFDPDIIRTAEVFTGAFPAGYGNRLSSVVNLTTKQGNVSRVAATSELNFLAAKALVEGPIGGNDSWIVSGRKSLFDGSYKHFVGSSLPISFYDLFFKGTIGTETGRASGRGFISGDRIVSDNPDEPDYSWENRSFAASVSGLANDRLYVDALAYSSSFTVTQDAKASSVVRSAESSILDNGVRLDLSLHTDAQDLFDAGFEFDFPEYDYKYSTPVDERLEFNSIETELWLWFRYVKQFGRFKADVGLHVDALSLFDNGPGLGALEPRVSVHYKLSDLWTASLAYGTFDQREVTISNEDDIISLFEAWIPIPTGLKPEEAHHYVFGVEGLPASNFSLSVQTYLKNYPSLVVYNREKLYPTDPDFINGTGKAYGTEFLARFNLSVVEAYLSYSLAWSRVTNDGLTYPPRYDRRHTINLLGVVHPLRDVDVAVRWEFGSGYPYTQSAGYYDRLLFGGIGNGQLIGESGQPYSILEEKNAARLPAYYRIDASATYHFVLSPFRGSVGASFANLTDRKNILSYDRKTGQRINMLDFFPSATLKMEF